MKKIVAIAVILLAIVIAPYITGKLVKNKFEHKIALLNNKLETIFHKKDLIKLEYQSGWFSSEATTTIDKVVVSHHIIHGPYCTFSVAKIESSFEISEKSKKDLDTLFDGKAPYTITTQLDFLGTIHFNITSPAFGEKTLPNDANTLITWQGLDYTATIEKDLISSSLNIPKLSIDEKEKGYFLIDNIKSQGTTSRFLDSEFDFVIPKDIKLDGTSSISKIIFKITDKRLPTDVQINNITTQLQTKDDNYISSFAIDNIATTSGVNTFSTDKISFDSTISDPFWILRNNLTEADWNSFSTFLLKNINFNNSENATKVALDFKQEQQLTDDKVNINFRELYKASDINLQLPNYNNLFSNVELSYQINGLPKAPLAKVLNDYITLIKHSFLTGFNAALNRQDTQALTNNYKTMLQNKANLMASGQSFALATLQSTPSITISTKSQGSKGDAGLDFKAALIKPDVTTDLTMLAMKAQSRTNAKLSVNVAESLVDAASIFAGIDNDQLATIKQEAMQRFPIINNNGIFSVDIEYKNSAFYVNGQLDPNFLQKYSQSFR